MLQLVHTAHPCSYVRRLEGEVLRLHVVLVMSVRLEGHRALSPVRLELSTFSQARSSYCLRQSLVFHDVTNHEINGLYVHHLTFPERENTLALGGIILANDSMISQDLLSW